MSQLRDLSSGNTRHPLYPLFLGIFGMLCVLAGVFYAAAYRPVAAHAEPGPAALASGALNAQPPTFQAVTPSAANPFREVVGRMRPAVVNILAERPSQGRQGGMDQFQFKFPSPFGGEDEQAPSQGFEEQPLQPSAGSGFIVDPRGYIITNFHVIENASRLTVTLGDRKVIDATVVGSDPATDVAVIKLDEVPEDLPYLQLGDSNAVEPGDWVIAIGSPLGLQQTVTVGVVSAKNRTQVTVPEERFVYGDFIQTDAAINFGNSGGPLLTADGRVIGMNTMIAGGAGVSGIGFAVPANKIKFVYQSLIDHGTVERGFLGIEVRPVTRNMAKLNGMQSPYGALVQGTVSSDTPAGRAGIQTGDIITAVDGVEVQDREHLINLIADKGVGANVELSVLRDQANLTLRVTTARRPEQGGTAARVEPATPAAPEGSSLKLDNLGLLVAPITEEMRERYDYPGQGVIVASVKANSEAYREGMDDGDVITRVGETPVTSVEEFQNAMSASQGALVRIHVQRRIQAEWVSLLFALPTTGG